jgi:hypothetical protein
MKLEVGAGGGLANGSGQRWSSHNEFFRVVSGFFNNFPFIIEIKPESCYL